jgi:hypothetical protein
MQRQEKTLLLCQAFSVRQEFRYSVLCYGLPVTRGVETCILY